jgi:hypothetical protein
MLCIYTFFKFYILCVELYISTNPDLHSIVDYIYVVQECIKDRYHENFHNFLVSFLFLQDLCSYEQGCAAVKH